MYGAQKAIPLKTKGVKKRERKIKNTRCSKAKEIQHRLAEDSRGSNGCKPLAIEKTTGKIGIRAGRKKKKDLIS
jgi:hypothetical protein